MSITSANSVVALSVAGLFPTPVILQGFSTERAWETENLTLAEIQMSVDGRKTSGFTPNPVSQTFSLQGDSPSKQFFNSIVNATKQARENFLISGTIDLPATGESFICSRGTLQAVKALPDAGKVLQAMNFTIVWESINQTLS
jgi:hypothetical protein